MQQLRSVGIDDVRRCIAQHISRLFTSSAAVVVCCAGGLAVPVRRAVQSRATSQKVELLTLKDCIQRAVLVRDDLMVCSFCVYVSFT